MLTQTSAYYVLNQVVFALLKKKKKCFRPRRRLKEDWLKISPDESCLGPSVRVGAASRFRNSSWFSLYFLAKFCQVLIIIDVFVIAESLI